MWLLAILCCALILGQPPTRVDADAAAGRSQTAVKMFSSDKWGIALDYPAAWSIEDDGDEVTFRSEDGQSVLLARVGADSPSEPAPGRRTAARNCSTLTTMHDVPATVCVDPS